MTHRKLPFLVLAGVLLTPGIACAVCEDPKTGASGYRIPLEKELHSSIAVIVGEVVDEKRFHDVPEDPEQYFSIFTVRIDRQLKGRLPAIVTFRVELTSARYDMTVGERHVLFIWKWPWKIEAADFQIDACGNSSVLPKGEGVLAEVVADLRGTSHAP
jgi:hypothetical protein